MAAIGKEGGKKGIRTLAARYFGGSIAEAMRHLRQRGWEKLVAGLVDEKLDRQLAEGAQVAVEEIPVVLDVDADPFYQASTYWRDRVKAEKEAEMLR